MYRCSSNVGVQGGVQYVSLGSGCTQHGIIVHEIGQYNRNWYIFISFFMSVYEIQPILGTVKILIFFFRAQPLTSSSESRKMYKPEYLKMRKINLNKFAQVQSSGNVQNVSRSVRFKQFV